MFGAIVGTAALGLIVSLFGDRYECSPEEVQAACDELSNISNNTLQAINEEIGKNVTIVNNAAYGYVDISNMNAYAPAVQDSITNLMGVLDKQAQIIEEYNNGSLVEKMLGTGTMAILNLTEGVLKFGEDIVDAGANIIAGVGTLCGFDMEEVELWAAKDHVGDAFDNAFENGALSWVEKYSIYSHESTFAEILKGFGTTIPYIALAATGVGLIAEAGIAGAAGFGRGSTNYQQQHLVYDANGKANFDETYSTGSMMWEGTKQAAFDAATTVIMDKGIKAIGNKISSLKAGKAVAENADDAAKALTSSTDDLARAATNSTDDVTKALTKTSDDITRATTNNVDDIAKGMTDDEIASSISKLKETAQKDGTLFDSIKEGTSFKNSKSSSPLNNTGKVNLATPKETQEIIEGLAGQGKKLESLGGLADNKEIVQLQDQLYKLRAGGLEKNASKIAAIEKELDNYVVMVDNSMVKSYTPSFGKSAGVTFDGGAGYASSVYKSANSSYGAFKKGLLNSSDDIAKINMQYAGSAIDNTKIYKIVDASTSASPKSLVPWSGGVPQVVPKTSPPVVPSEIIPKKTPPVLPSGVTSKAPKKMLGLAGAIAAEKSYGNIKTSYIPTDLATNDIKAMAGDGASRITIDEIDDIATMPTQITAKQEPTPKQPSQASNGSSSNGSNYTGGSSNNTGGTYTAPTKPSGNNSTTNSNSNTNNIQTQAPGNNNIGTKSEENISNAGNNQTNMSDNSNKTPNENKTTSPEPSDNRSTVISNPPSNNNQGSSGTNHGGTYNNSGNNNNWSSGYTSNNEPELNPELSPELEPELPIEEPELPEVPIEEESVYTIPSNLSGVKETKKSTSGNSVLPILGGLGAAAAIGVGAKMYLDNKKNNENGDDEEYSENDNEKFSYSGTDDLLADEWNGEDTRFNYEDTPGDNSVVTDDDLGEM